MKQVLKKVLPKPVVQKMIILRDQLHLSMTPRQDFQESALRPAVSASHLHDIFMNAQTEDSWKQAFSRIKNVYGETTAMGGVNPGDRRALYYLINALKPQSMLEVGTHIGASTVFLAEALKDTGSNATLTTVDILDVNAPEGPWKEQGLRMPPRQYLEALGTADSVQFRQSPSTTYLETTDKRFDLIFLDGDHSSRSVYEEVSLSLKVLNKDGVILLHDYYPAARALFNDGNIIAGPFMAIDRVMRENKNIRVVPLGNLPWETKQGLHTTSLALLTRVN